MRCVPASGLLRQCVSPRMRFELDSYMCVPTRDPVRAFALECPLSTLGICWHCCRVCPRMLPPSVCPRSILLCDSAPRREIFCIKRISIVCPCQRGVVG